MYPLNYKTRSLSILSVLVMLALVLAACSPNAGAAQPTATTEPTPIPAAATTASGGPVTLKVSQNATLGSFLTDQNGMTLYLYQKDTNGASTCFGGCLAAWPALLTNGAPVAGDPSITGQLGITTRPDGSQQVTYNGAPLYYFLKDKNAGDTTGQGVGSVWYVVPPSPTTSAATATTAPTTAAIATPTGPATLKVA